MWDWLASIPMANIIAFGAGLPGAALAAWTFIITRKDTRTKDERQSQADRNKELRAQEQGILDWTKSELVESRAQVGRNEAAYRKQLLDIEAERDFWEARARWWYARAHEMLSLLREARHLAANCSQIIANLIANGQIHDPGFTELSDDTPRLPTRVENIEDKA